MISLDTGREPELAALASWLILLAMRDLSRVPKSLASCPRYHHCIAQTAHRFLF